MALIRETALVSSSQGERIPIASGAQAVGKAAQAEEGEPLEAEPLVNGPRIYAPRRQKTLDQFGLRSPKRLQV